MKKIFFIILSFLFLCSCSHTSKKNIKKNQPISYYSFDGVNAIHLSILKEKFPNESNKIIRVFRNRKHIENETSSGYKHGFYDVIIYQTEYSYIFRITYEAEFIENKCISFRQKNCILVDKIEEIEEIE